MHETTTTVRIFADGEFRIAIVETKDMYEYWLNHINLGKAMFIYGLHKEDIPYEELKEMIKDELEEDEEHYLETMQIEEYFWSKQLKEEQ